MINQSEKAGESVGAVLGILGGPEQATVTAYDSWT
jgi:hypothetical protein